jgi:hypothetical protein
MVPRVKPKGGFSEKAGFRFFRIVLQGYLRSVKRPIKSGCERLGHMVALRGDGGA